MGFHVADVPLEIRQHIVRVSAAAAAACWFGTLLPVSFSFVFAPMAVHSEVARGEQGDCSWSHKEQLRNEAGDVRGHATGFSFPLSFPECQIQ